MLEYNKLSLKLSVALVRSWLASSSVTHLDRYYDDIRKIYKILCGLAYTTASILSLVLYSKRYFIDPAQLRIPPPGAIPEDKNNRLYPNFALGVLRIYRYDPHKHGETEDFAAISDLAKITAAVNRTIDAFCFFDTFFRQVEHESNKIHDLLVEVTYERSLMRVFGIFLRLLPDEWETKDSDAAGVYQLWREDDKEVDNEPGYTGRGSKIMASDLIKELRQANREMLDLFLQVTGGIETMPSRIEAVRFACRDVYGVPLKDWDVMETKVMETDGIEADGVDMEADHVMEASVKAKCD
ncbi:hypothetical protein BJ508DRAFT_380919 [Ascobolus immersus RN42]|uniref:Uncharacterized protein n=1 Tax=Ascobolus immersus RN42 TaxID=1160509 RepID=A0A3N4HPL7_ASCIM|nr:hypothetical protein BJ508DRAFT_380919 [Ascobolus immersus RN42]